MVSTTIFFLFVLLLHETIAQNNCSTDYCSRRLNPVRFPFHLQGDGQPSSCGFSGFELSCSAIGDTVLRLPNSGDFIVRSINYLNQRIVLYDSTYCLPGRLLKLNLTGSPFSSPYYDSYTLFDCPNNERSSYSDTVPCLSNATNTVVATTNNTYSDYLSNSSPCEFNASYRLPVSSWRHATVTDLSTDLTLSWYAPNCRDCELKRGICGFRNYTALQIGCFYKPETGRTGLDVFILICITIAVPMGICAIIIGCFLACANLEDRTQTSNTEHNNIAIVPEPHHILPIGLDDSTIQSFDKVVVGESLRLSGPNHIVCSICLSEYLPKDILRCIPECKHCFHVDCVDEWLRMNSSCPICRNSPAPSPSHLNSHHSTNITY